MCGITISPPPANAASKLDLTGGTMTGQLVLQLASATGAVNVSPTWNNGAVSFVGIYGRVTNTASGASSCLIDLGTVAGGSKFAVNAVHGTLLLNGATVASGSIARRADVDMLMLHNVTSTSATSIVGIGGGGYNIGINISQNAHLAWTNDTPAATRDITLMRAAAGILALTASASTGGATLEFREQTAPSAPSTNNVRIYAEDNGSGKTRLMARFATGAAQQIAIEP